MKPAASHIPFPLFAALHKASVPSFFPHCNKEAALRSPDWSDAANIDRGILTPRGARSALSIPVLNSARPPIMRQETRRDSLTGRTGHDGLLQPMSLTTPLS